MGFDQLPTFREGEANGPEAGAPGIPPELFGGAPVTRTDISAILPVPRPEDIPGVQQVMRREADALAQQLGLAPRSPQPATAPGAAPAQPATPPQAAAPQLPPSYPQAAPGAVPGAATRPQRTTEEKIAAVIAKYGGDRMSIAKAYVNAQAGMTQAMQGRAQAIGELRQFDERLGRIESLLERLPARAQDGTIPPAGAGNGTEPAPAGSDPKAFFDDPEAATRRVVERVLRRELSAFGEAQARQAAADREERAFRATLERDAQKINMLQPVIDDLYRQNPRLYDSLPRDQALSLLVERAEERVKAWQGQEFHREMQEVFGANGGAATAPPGQHGTLPAGGGGGQSVTTPANQPPSGGWSTTPLMQNLWRTPSDGQDELRTVMGILRERGHWSDVAKP